MDQVRKVVAKLASSLATPRALAVHLLVQGGEWTQLQELRVDPSHYVDAESYWKDCLATDLLRKCDLPSDVDREKAAVRTFLECELHNARTNARLSRFLDNFELLESESEKRVKDFINLWRKEVSRVLGALPHDLTPRFSGGATYGDSGRLTTIPDKMSSIPTHTRGMRDLLSFWRGSAWERAHLSTNPRAYTREVRGNIFFTVPKDGKTRRGCCKEPSLNISFQLDVGRELKKRLRDRMGIDLKVGQDLHRTLAREASSLGHLGTIDLSNASDNVSRVLVDLIVRSDWASLLKSLRSPSTRLGKVWYRLEKFSSMGNGFTFELETLLFGSLARCIVSQEGGNPDQVKCYGDDLIVPVEHCASVLSALKFFGFTPNARKTFTQGPFRESCGGDFFDGTPVRAHFIEELPDEPQEWISLANGLRRTATAPGAPPYRWDLVRSAWRVCIEQLPSEIRRCRGPSFLGDVVLHDVPEEWCLWRGDTPPRPFHQCGGRGWDAVWVRAYTPVARVIPWQHWRPAVQLASCTLGLPSRGVAPRGGITGYKLSWVLANLTNDWLPG